MNQFFDSKRFGLLVLKHWEDNKKRYSLSVLAYFVLIITWFLFGLIIEGDKGLPLDTQDGAFFFTFFLVGTFYASQYFSDLASRDKGSHFLLVPTSTFEKLLCSLFFTVILFPLLFISAFYLADFLMISIANVFYANGKIEVKSTVTNIFVTDYLRFDNNRAINVLLFFLSIQSLFLVGSVYFKKYNFIKTIITGFLICFLVFSFVYLMVEKVLPQKEDDYYFLKIEKWFPTFIMVVAYSIAPLSWTAAYFLLKAKQV